MAASYRSTASASSSTSSRCGSPSGPVMNASDLIVQCLENEGVRYVFGLLGEEILDILDSLADSRVTFIPTRHEQGAAFMADAYGRLTGTAGVCLSTLGPGATNLATGIADANLDRAPLVAITGQAARDRIHKESHQHVDIIEHLRPLTKWNTRLETATVIPEVIRKAFKLAESEKPGACHVEDAPKFWNPDRKKPIIHIDFTPAEVDSFYQPVVEVVADVREALELLKDMVRGEKDPSPYLELRRLILEDLEEGADDQTFPLKPQHILRELRTRMGREDILISDVGTHKLWIARTFPAYEPNTVLISNGLAAMGFALPAAIAAKLVHPERKVGAVSGDGGFLMNSQELETARRLGLAVVNVIFRDGGYNLIQWKQQTHLGRESGVKFGNPDFVALAGAFGAKGYRVDSAKALGPILAEALGHPGPSIVDVPVDYEGAKLTAGLGQLICPI